MTHEQQIQGFLAGLDDTHREGFMAYAEHTYSVVEIWLYASVLGYEGTFSALEKWVAATFPKLNRKGILLAETVKLEGDIDVLRQQVQMDLVSPADAASKIAHLSKELRSHLVEIDKMSKAADRKGLIMAGADRVLRELKAIFKGNEDLMNALNLASESVWAMLADEA
tara:strand:- start:1289 stop:1792 length:504 start_codon:yes stop_codon:yes gene_type:complete